MSISTAALLYCNGNAYTCPLGGGVFEPDEYASTAAEVRRRARSAGWTRPRIDGVRCDLCAACTLARRKALSGVRSTRAASKPAQVMRGVRARRMAAGCCIYCPDEKPLPGRLYGSKCKQAFADRRRKTEERAERALIAELRNREPRL